MWEQEVPLLNVTFPSQNLQDILNYRCIYILFLFRYKNCFSSSQESVPQWPWSLQCRHLPAQGSLLCLQSQQQSSELWILQLHAAPRGFPSCHQMPTDQNHLHITSGEPPLLVLWLFSLPRAHTCTHTHTEGKIRSDKACRWKLGNAAIIVSHVILIQAFVQGF